MSSSTFSSERISQPRPATLPGERGRRPRRAAWTVERQCVAIFLLTFLAALVAARLAMRVRAAAAAVGGGHPLAVTAVISPSPDDYLGYFRGSVDEYAIYDNFGHAADALKKADVLFLGNSRVMFAFREREQLDHYFAARSLRYYVMAFPYGEQSALPEAVIRRYDLHPKWVIVNPDPFFGGKPSKVGAKVLADTRFDAFKFRLETVSAFQSQRLLHRIVPYLGTLWPQDDQEGEWIWYRSKQNGTIFLSGARGTPGPAVPHGENAYGSLWEPGRVPGARSFKQDIERRGAKLILMRIPPDSDVSAVGFSKVLHVPLIAPTLPGLRTLDGNHLDDPSAKRFDAEFLKELSPILDGPEQP